MRKKASSNASASKLTEPQLVHGACERTRLFRRLDSLHRHHPLLWVEGLAGAGKTTLVASWLRKSKRSRLWLQLDASDSDPATFFHQLSAAVRHRKRSARVPAFAPEHHVDPATFARHFFAALEGCLTANTVIVFDNVQEVAPEMLVVLAAGLERLSPSLSAVFLSRSRLPTAFTRLEMLERVAILGASELAMSVEEAEDTAALRGVRDPERIARAHAGSSGWMAGFVLLLAQDAEDVAPGHGKTALHRWFRYAVATAVDSPEARSFLCVSALLPTMPQKDLRALGGTPRDLGAVETLANHNFFTYALSEAPGTYQYHPLFREFLLEELAQETPAARVAELSREVAALLARRGEVEEAAALALRAGERPQLSALVREHAPRLLAEGRVRVIETWLSAFDEDALDAEPWLHYWRGACWTGRDPGAGQRELERAFEGFERDEDAVGMFSAAADILVAIFYHFESFEQVDRWSETIERLQARYPHVLAGDLELSVTAAMLLLLPWHRPSDPRLGAWIDRGEQLLSSVRDPRQALLLANALVYPIAHRGEGGRALAVHRAMTKRLAKERNPPPPLLLIHHYTLGAMLGWQTDDDEQCFAQVEAGRAFCQEQGVHLFDTHLLGQAVTCAARRLDQPLAERWLAAISDVRPNEEERAFHGLLTAQTYRLGRRFEEAEQHLDRSLEVIARVQNGMGEAYCLAERVTILIEQERWSEARDGYAAFCESARDVGLFDAFVHLIGGVLLLHDGERGPALREIARGLALAAVRTRASYFSFGETALATVCSTAYAEGFERDYVRSIVQRSHVAPPRGLEARRAWPWASRVYVLSGTRVEREGDDAGQAQTGGRPLDLLLLLVANGPNGLTVSRATEAFWPERSAGGYRAFKVTVHRLRRLVGDDAVRVEGGRIRLDVGLLWVDLWEFDAAIQAAQALKRRDPSLARQELSAAVALWGAGAFDERWNDTALFSSRERWRRQYESAVLTLGEAIEHDGDTEAALGVYQRALAVDETNELLWERLLATHVRLGQRAQGLHAYERCTSVLRRTLGVEPSKTISQHHDALRANSRHHDG